MTAPAVAEDAVPWFWVMTLNWPTEAGVFTVATESGTAIWPSPVGRRTAFGEVLAAAMSGLGVPEGSRVAVLFFHLEPDPDASPDQRRQAETGTVNHTYDRGMRP